MKIVNISHVSFPGEQDPEAWIGKSLFFKGIWEAVARTEEVIFIDFIGYSGTVKRNGIEYRFLKRSRRTLRLPLRLHRIIAAEEPDVVVVHGMQFPLPLLSLRFFLKKQCLLIIQDHGGTLLQHPVKQWLQRLTATRVDAYFFTAAEQAEPYLKAGIINDRQKVNELMEVSSVFQPVDRDSAMTSTKVAGTPAYIWVGHLKAEKDPMTAVKAFSRLAEQAPGASLYMIFQSNDLLPQIKEWLVQHPEAAQRIHLVGKVAHADLVYWFSSADFILSSSHKEVAGVSVAEGMSCGCIPVLSNIPAFSAITGGNCGVLFEKGNEQALLDALQASLHMDKVEERRKTLMQFKEQLSFDAIACRIKKILQDVTGKTVHR